MPPIRSSPQKELLGGQYRLGQVVGTGGMGVVYEATDVRLNRKVAVKLIRGEYRADSSLRERFLREARVVASLKHPNIVQIYSVVEEGSDVFLVFEYVSGTTLAKLLSKKRRLPVETAMRIFEPAGLGLEFAHSRQIVHRDFTPSNIMITPSDRIKVMDFGLAFEDLDADSTIPATTSVAGTPPYMSPEQYSGRPRAASDVYSFAVSFYEALAGKRPFFGEKMLENKMAIRFPSLSKAAGLPGKVDAVFARAFDPNPSQRWSSPTEFLSRFESAWQTAKR